MFFHKLVSYKLLKTILKTMEFILNDAELTSTKSFKKLEQCYKNILLRSANKKLIGQALLIYRNTRCIPGNIAGNNLKVLKDLIAKEENKEVIKNISPAGIVDGFL
jgi:TRAP-type C4-dicarboxylate transport system substrate-binding protein